MMSFETVADCIISCCIENTTDGNWCVSYSEYLRYANELYSSYEPVSEYIYTHYTYNIEDALFGDERILDATWDENDKCYYITVGFAYCNFDEPDDLIEEEEY